MYHVLYIHVCKNTDLGPLNPSMVGFIPHATKVKASGTDGTKQAVRSAHLVRVANR